MKCTTDDPKLQPTFDASRRNSGSRSAKGFTIVEVMIVLAIAGLILLIVFEAIPSLTRAARNGRRKQDISVILDAVSNYELKNSDNFPQNCGGANPPTPANPACNTGYNPPSSYPNDYFLQFVKNDLSYYTYTPTNTDPVVLVAKGQGNAGYTPVTNTEQVYVYDYEKCDSNGDGGANSTGADYNDVVALYALENGTSSTNTGTPQCQQL